MNWETRQIEDPQLSTRAAENEQAATVISGYAVRYGRLSHPMKVAGIEFREKFAPGAFSSDLNGGRDVRALVNHDKTRVIGRRSAGTLRLFDEPEGLRFEIDLPDTSYARDLAESIRRGDVNGVSFGFLNPVSRLAVEVGQRIREVTSASLKEISIVTFPAYEGSELAIRELQDEQLAQQLQDLTKSPTNPNRQQAHQQLRRMSL